MKLWWIYAVGLTIIGLSLAYNNKESTARVMKFLSGIAKWFKDIKDEIWG